MRSPVTSLVDRVMPLDPKHVGRTRRLVVSLRHAATILKSILATALSAQAQQRRYVISGAGQPFGHICKHLRCEQNGFEQSCDGAFPSQDGMPPVNVWLLSSARP